MVGHIPLEIPAEFGSGIIVLEGLQGLTSVFLHVVLFITDSAGGVADLLLHLTTTRFGGKSSAFGVASRLLVVVFYLFFRFCEISSRHIGLCCLSSGREDSCMDLILFVQPPRLLRRFWRWSSAVSVNIRL